MGFLGLGELPKEYNRKIHGPYDPAIYYGKKDPIGNLKVIEVPAWLLRRKYDPTSVGRFFSRTYWRWAHKYVYPRKAGLAPLLQLTALYCTFFYAINYKTISHHKNYKYHW